MRGNIYTGKTNQTPKKIMDDNFSDVQCLLKNGKIRLISCSLKKNFKYTTSCIDLHKCIMFNVVKHLNSISTMKSFTKPNCIIYTEERYMINAPHSLT